MIRREWLRRELRTLDLYSLVHADSQSTFYLAIGFILAFGGRESFFISIYAVALMISIALVYGEIGSRFPEAGGSYLYVKQAMGRFFGFLSAWLLMFDQAIMISYGAIDTSNYILTYLGVNNIPTQIPSLAISLALYILTLLGIRESARVAMAIAMMDFMVIGVLLIGVNLIMGIGSMPPYFTWGIVKPADLLAALSIASRGFTGVDAIGQLAGEATEPLLQVPRATFLVASIGTVYSLFLVAIAMDRIGYNTLIRDPSLALFLVAVNTPYISAITAPLTVANIAAIMLMASLAGYVAFSRLAYILAKDSLIPSSLISLHPRYRTPYASLTLAFLISVAFILPGEVSFILEVYAIGSLVNYFMISVALWIIARRGELFGGLAGPKIFGIPLTSITGAILTLFGLGINIIAKWGYIWIIALWLLTGLFMYSIFREKKGI
ncbi:MAG: amino acid permease [Desulfurococcales archaeon]|nr:amino acid permease [Desulfurococcales archaeon]